MRAATRVNNVRQWLSPSNVCPLAMVVTFLNRKLRGWGNYFRYGSVLRVRQKLDRFVCDRVRHLLRRRNKPNPRNAPLPLGARLRRTRRPFSQRPPKARYVNAPL